MRGEILKVAKKWERERAGDPEKNRSAKKIRFFL